MAKKFIPEGYPQVSPYLIVDDPAALIQFITDVFGAKETRRHEDDKGRIAHAEVRIGDSVIMMGGATEQWPAASAAMYVYVEDTDAAYQRGLAAGRDVAAGTGRSVLWRPPPASRTASATSGSSAPTSRR